MSDEELEHMARSAGLLDVIDDAYLARGDWLPEAREFAELLQSAERERCAKYLRDAAARLAPEGKRINQIDRHTAHILACKGDELAAGYAWRDSAEGGAEMTAEQQARDMLERMEIDGAQSFSSGDIVELANLLNFSQLLTKKNVELGVKVVDGTIAARRISDENKKLRAFARDVMEAWPEGGIEGDDLQEIAVKHGMLAPEIRHEPCGEWCNCNAGVDVDGGEWERGVECYRRTALLTGESE